MPSRFDRFVQSTPQPQPEPTPSRFSRYIAPKSVFSKYVAPSGGVLGDIEGAGGKALSFVGDILARPSRASKALIARGGGAGLQTLLHDESQSQEDADREVVRRDIGMSGIYQHLPHAVQGSIDIGIDMLSDPTTYMGGLGIIRKALEEGGIHAAPIIARLASRSKLGSAAYDTLVHKGDTVRQIFENTKDPHEAQRLIQEQELRLRKTTNQIKQPAHIETQRYEKIFEGLSPAQQRSVLQAVDKGRKLKDPQLQKAADELRNLYRTHEYIEGTRAVQQRLSQSGFKPPEEIANVIGTNPRGILRKTRPNYVPHGSALSGASANDIRQMQQRAITEDELLGYEPTQRVTGKSKLFESKPGFVKPRTPDSRLQAELERQHEINKARIYAGYRTIAARDLKRDLSKSYGRSDTVYRKVPPKITPQQAYREATDGLSEHEKSIVNRLINGAAESSIPNDVDKAKLLQRAADVTGAIKGTLSPERIATMRKTQSFGSVPNELKKYFVEPKPLTETQQRLLPHGEMRVLGRNVGDIVKGAVNLTNIPYFTLPLRHMANLTTLGLLHDPLSTAQAVGRYMIGAVHPGMREANEDLINLARREGHLSYASERQLPETIQHAVESVRNMPAVGKPLGAAADLFSKEYAWSNRALWSFDDMLRAQMVQRAMKGGATAAKASHDVNRAMIDYALKSPLTQGAAYAFPFASFRTKLPGAVMRGIATHPERAHFLDALTGGTFTGGQNDNMPITKEYLPAADVGRGVTAPQAYLRSALSFPIKDTTTIAEDALAGGLPAVNADVNPFAKDVPFIQHSKRYMTYGHRPVEMLPGQLFGGIPGAEEALQQLHLDPFQRQELLKSLLQGYFGLKAR